jgi:sarcosine reductase
LSATETRRPAAGLNVMTREVAGVAMGEETSFLDGWLTVGRDLAAGCFEDRALAEVRIRTVSPGDPVRIVKVLDAVEPRCHADGGESFPGLLGPALPGTHGGGIHVLRGAAVLSAGFLPRAQEGAIQMAGPGAELSPLSRTHNAVVEFEPAADAPWEKVASALRLGVLRLASELARSALGCPPDEVDELPASGGGGPRVVAVTNLQTQGAFKDVLVYGRSLAGGLPTWIAASELANGAVVSAQYGHPALKNPTIVFQNHPVLAALGAHPDAEPLGAVICPEPVEEGEKRLVSEHAARLCAALGADGAIVTKEGGGNADADVALKLEALERQGIPAVGLFAEMAGRDGSTPGLVAAPGCGSALVSTGNYDARARLGACQEALGGERLDIVDTPATEAVELPLGAVYGALNPLGWGHLTCAEGV